MELIYYRDSNGKIYRYHLPPGDLTKEKLAIEMARFNERYDAKVFCQEIEEGSLEMYLFEQAQIRKRFPKGLVQDALDSLAEARGAIECLDVEG